LNPRPLGYEPYDECFRCLGQSPVIALASVNPQREVVSDLLCLTHCSLSRRRRVRFTQSVPGRWLLLLLSAVSGLHLLVPCGVTVWTLRVRVWRR
jgi:hypothetical protein